MARGGTGSKSRLAIDPTMPINSFGEGDPADFVFVPKAHYDELMRNASTTAISPDDTYNCEARERMIRTSDLEDFVRPGMTTPCRISTLSVSEGGYTKTTYKSNPDQRSKSVYSHRLALLLEQGYLTPGMVVMHLCDNPRCHEAKGHLREGTPAENSRDAADKGKQGRDKDRSDEILALMHRGDTNREIAERFGMLNQTVTNLRSVWRKQGLLPAHQNAYQKLTQAQTAWIRERLDAGEKEYCIAKAVGTTITAVETVRDNQSPDADASAKV